MNTALWVVAGLLAAGFLFAGSNKLPYLYYKAPVIVRRAGALDARPKGYPGMSVLVAAYVNGFTALVALIALSST